MEIRNTSKLGGGREAGGEVKPTERTRGAPDAATAGASSGPGDRVTLTEAAQRLLGAARANGVVPVDEARIERLRAAIADGTYHVDAARIAARLVELDNPE